MVVVVGGRHGGVRLKGRMAKLGLCGPAFAASMDSSVIRHPGIVVDWSMELLGRMLDRD